MLLTFESREVPEPNPDPGTIETVWSVPQRQRDLKTHQTVDRFDAGKPITLHMLTILHPRSRRSSGGSDRPSRRRWPWPWPQSRRMRRARCIFRLRFARLPLIHVAAAGRSPRFEEQLKSRKHQENVDCQDLHISIKVYSQQILF